MLACKFAVGQLRCVSQQPRLSILFEWNHGAMQHGCLSNASYVDVCEIPSATLGCKDANLVRLSSTSACIWSHACLIPSGGFGSPAGIGGSFPSQQPGTVFGTSFASCSLHFLREQR